MGAVYYAYRVLKIDLVMMSFFSLFFSAVVVNSVMHMINSSNFNLTTMLFLGLLIIGLGALSAKWLKMLQKKAKDAN